MLHPPLLQLFRQITQEVMRQEVGRKISFTPGEVQQYFEQHKQEYAQPESIKLGEILVSTGTGAEQDDPQKIAAAKAKADDIEAKLHSGGDFTQLAKSFSDGPTAAEGGDLGQFRRGSLAKVLEDQTFALNAGQYTEPIRTKQGWVVLKVIEHTPGGVPPFKDVEQDVEQAYYVSRMEPAMRGGLIRTEVDTFNYPPDLQTLVDGVDLNSGGASAIGGAAPVGSAPTAGFMSGPSTGTPNPAAGFGSSSNSNASSALASVTMHVRFLRKIPIDPMTGKADWGMRSVQDDPDSNAWGGQDVFDVLLACRWHRARWHEILGLVGCYELTAT